MPYTLADGTTILIMGLSDLILTKKTQRLKDWGAIELLLDASIARSSAPSAALVTVWLEELRELQDGLDADAAYQKSLSSELEAMRQQARRDPRQEHPLEP